MILTFSRVEGKIAYVLSLSFYFSQNSLQVEQQYFLVLLEIWGCLKL